MSWVDAQRVKTHMVNRHVGWSFTLVVQFPRVDVSHLITGHTVAHDISWCFMNAASPDPTAIGVRRLIDLLPKALREGSSGSRLDSVEW